jgi:ligand-binding sensor domain-containing protein
MPFNIHLAITARQIFRAFNLFSIKRQSFLSLSLALISLFEISPTQTFAQFNDALVSDLSINNGLSQSNVKYILKDKTGIFWFATDDGLNKYDGYNFTIYRHDIRNPHSLRVNNVNTMLEDSFGNFWVATGGGGLSLFDKKSEHFTNLRANKNNRQTLTNDDVTSIYQDSKNRIWVGTYSGLNLLDPVTLKTKQFFYQKDKDYLAEDHIYSIAEDRDGNLWLATDAGLTMFNYTTGTVKRYNHNNADSKTLAGDNIRKVFIDNQDLIWIATTNKGLDMFNKKTGIFSHHTHLAGDNKTIVSNSIFSITAAAGNKLWIGTEEGLELFDKTSGNFDHHLNRVNNKAISVNCVYLDNNILWMGSFESGVIKFDNNIPYFSRYYKQSDAPLQLTSSAVTSFAETENKIWIGTDGGGLNFFDKGTKKFTHDVAGITSKKVLCMLKDDEDKIWMGTFGAGLDVADVKANKMAHFGSGNTENQITSNNVFALAKNSNGEVWVGLDEGGVNVIKKTTKL